MMNSKTSMGTSVILAFAEVDLSPPITPRCSLRADASAFSADWVGLEVNRMASSFLQCPAEIREQIYRDVLSSSSAKKDSGLSDCCARYSYQLNILRTNRQIYHEAKKVFRDNIFVKITTPWPEAIEHISSEGKVPVVAAGERAERFTDFHLWVYIDAPAAPPNHETHSMIICLEDLEAFTWTWHYNNLNYPGLNTHLSLKLTIQDPYISDRKIPKPLQQRLLSPFGVIKDLLVFSAHGSKLLPSVRDSLVKAQAVPDPTREECLEKATSLKESGTRALEAGDYRRALQQYFEAFEAIHIRINGRKRTIHADDYYVDELKIGRYKGQRGDYVRLVLRIGLVADVVLAYLKMEEYTEAHFWGKRSIVLFRQGIIGDETEDIEIDGTPSWIMETVGMHVPAKKEMGYIFYRTALASRALGKEADVKTLIKAAAVYLPDDQTVQAEKRALDRQQPLDSWLRRCDA